jgi:O-antigen/teichoic acid export membrane protein
MVYVAKNGFWLSLGQILSIVSVIASSIVFGYFLPKEVYGEYKFILSVVGVLGALSLSGLGTAVTQAVAISKEGVLRQSIKVMLRWGIVIFIVSVFLSVYYFSNQNYDLGIAILISGILTPFINAFGLVISFFSGKKDFKRSTLFALSQQIIITSLLILTSLFIQNALILIFVNFFSAFIVSYCIYLFTMNKFVINNENDESLIEHGKHLSYMNFFSNLANQLDKILVFHWVGAVELAVYSFAIAIPEQIKGSYKNLFNIALPKMASADQNLLKKSIIDKFIRLTTISVFIVVLYYFVSPYIYHIFFPKYLESIWYSQVYVLGLIAVPGIALFSMYFQVKQDRGTLYRLNLIGNIATIILTCVLVYRFGIVGAVIENGISWFILLFVNLYYFLRK